MHASDSMERENVLAALRRRLTDLAGGEVPFYVAEGMESHPIVEAFMRSVIAFEEATATNDFSQLLEAGVHVPEESTMDDRTLARKLWEIIHGLAERKVYLEHTDHLSDRELYRRLRNDILLQSTSDLDPASGYCAQIDLVGSCSEEDEYLFFKYYADEDMRAQWDEFYPDREIPPHEDPPYDRARRVPGAANRLAG